MRKEENEERKNGCKGGNVERKMDKEALKKRGRGDRKEKERRK